MCDDIDKLNKFQFNNMMPLIIMIECNMASVSSSVPLINIITITMDILALYI